VVSPWISPGRILAERLTLWDTVGGQIQQRRGLQASFGFRLLIRRSLVRAQVEEPSYARASWLAPAGFFVSPAFFVAVLLP
jgi:hypothetical protein